MLLPAAGKSLVSVLPGSTTPLTAVTELRKGEKREREGCAQITDYNIEGKFALVICGMNMKDF